MKTMTNMGNLPIPPEHLVPSLRLLLEAYNCAKHIGCTPDRYAVEAKAFWSIGTPQAVLRWLCDVGHVRHLLDTTPSGAKQRELEASPIDRFVEQSWFALTDEGSPFARDILSASQEITNTASEPQKDASDLVDEENSNGHTPDWDDSSGKLSVGDKIVKCLLSNARNQRLVLQSLQELGWPPSIDDPLPPGPSGDSTIRLRSVIRRLNKSQTPKLIEFESDGSLIHWNIALFQGDRTCEAPKPEQRDQ